MPILTAPHLYWGGTDCPGAQWPEWVPQLREQALAEEDDMTEEQWEMIQDIHHHIHVLIPETLAHLEVKLDAIPIRSDERVKKLAKQSLREGTG